VRRITLLLRVIMSTTFLWDRLTTLPPLSHDLVLVTSVGDLGNPLSLFFPAFRTGSNWPHWYQHSADPKHGAALARLQVPESDHVSDQETNNDPGSHLVENEGHES